MNAWQAKRVIHDESLRGCVWYDEPIATDSIVIRKNSDTEWEVFSTDERAGIWAAGLRKYETESEMFEDMMERLYARKKHAEAYCELFGRNPFMNGA